MITLERLTKRYDATTAVDEVSMVVEPRTITTIVGTSGSGKSTLLRMINRLVEPTSGRVLMDGQDTATEPAHLLRRRLVAPRVPDDDGCRSHDDGCRSHDD